MKMTFVKYKQAYTNLLKPAFNTITVQCQIFSPIVRNNN